MQWMSAAETGDAYTQSKLALEYSILGDTEREEFWYRKSAAHGHFRGLQGLAQVLSMKNLLCQNPQEKEALRDEEEGLLVDAFNAAIENETATDVDIAQCAMGLAYYYNKYSIYPEALFNFLFAEKVDPDLAPYTKDHIKNAKDNLSADVVAEIYDKVNAVFR